MSTSNRFANITQKKLLGYRDLNDRYLQYLQGLVHEAHAKVWDEPVVHDVALAIEADGASAIKITGTSIAADGEGRLLRISDAAVNDGINFENTNAVDYHVALKYIDVPYELDVNPRSGNPEYRSWTEEIGEKAVPDAVTDNGNGTITFRVDSVTEAGVNNAGRQVLVYKLVPNKNATTFAVAVETCTVSWTGSQNEVTTTGTLGQSTVSVVSGDYNVVMLGPTVKRYVDLRTQAGYVFIGIVTGNGGTPTTFDHTDQQLASITLSQLAHIAAKASNDRLKVDVVPLSNEVGIDQITSRDPTGKKIFTVDERGQVTTHGFPRTITENYPGSPCFNGTYKSFFDTTLENVKAIACCTVNTKRKIFIVDYVTRVAELWDVETMTMDSTQDLTSLFSNSNCQPISAFGEGQYVYLWSNYSTYTRINCIDVTTWTERSTWPTGGIGYDYCTTGPDIAYLGRMIVSIDSERFAWGRNLDGNQIVISSKYDGSQISSGDGDAPATDFEPRSICTDGKYIYAAFIEGTPGSTSYCVSIDVDNMSQGLGTAGWPHSIFAASDTYTANVATVDNYVACTSNSNYWFMFSKDGTPDFRLSPHWTALEKPPASCSDGAHLWFTGYYRDWGYSDNECNAVYRFNHHSLISPDGSGERNLQYFRRMIEPFAFDQDSDIGLVRGDALIFDGQDIWMLAQTPYPTHRIYRLPNVHYKHSSPARAVDQQLESISISSGVLTIDCMKDWIDVSVNQDITSFIVTNYQLDKKCIVRLYASGGTRSIDGFETGSYRKWPASPRPPFSLTSGYFALLELTCYDGTYVFFDYKGPYYNL